MASGVEIIYQCIHTHTAEGERGKRKRICNVLMMCLVCNG